MPEDKTRKPALHPSPIYSLISLFFAAMCAAACYQISASPQIADRPYYIVLACLSAAIAIALHIPLRARATFAAILLLMAIPILAFEGFVTVWFKDRIFGTTTGRDVSIFVTQMRNDGRDAFPFLYPMGNVRNHVIIGGKEYFPTSGIPNALTVLCREEGPFLTYQSDQYGFNNPSSAWQTPAMIGMVGDSYVHGACVEPKDHFSFALRQRYPQTLDLGAAGTGPFTALANIREYLQDQKPKVVFWFYSEGAAVSNWYQAGKSEIQGELSDSILPQYLDPTFSQHLKEAFPELRTRMIESINAKYAHTFAPSLLDRAVDWLTLRATYKVISTTVAAVSSVQLQRASRPAKFVDKNVWANEHVFSLSDERENIDKNLATYKAILEAARNEVKGWGGQLVFVYMPLLPPYLDLPRDKILGIVKDVGLPLVDLWPTFRQFAEPAKLFASTGSPYAGHYNAEGYALVTSALTSFLTAQAPQ